MANWYAVYEDATGALKSMGTVLGELPPGYSSVVVGQSRPDGVWNASTLQFDPKPLNPIIEKDMFMGRFTAAELRNTLGVDYSTATIEVRAFVNLLIALDKLDLSDDLITQGMTKLVQAGILTAERAQEITAYA